MSAPFFWNRRTWALGLGAAIGVGFAFLVEISGHPSWAILLLMISAVAPSGILLFSDPSSLSDLMGGTITICVRIAELIRA